MAALPLIRDTTPGIYQLLTAANADYRIAIPAGAVGCIVWFETSATDATMIRGRIGMDETDAEVTVTNTSLGFQPPMPVEYELDARATRDEDGVLRYERDAYLHVASSTAGAVVRGMWLFRSDAG